MFERYTEKARRVIFFARYEASYYGSPEIETEHLLLGILREDQSLSLKFLQTPEGFEPLRSRIDQHYPNRKPSATSVDLPLSDESKRVLAYAGEESERLAHRHIGSEHLLLALAREEKTVASELLRDCGFDPQKLREEADKRPSVIEETWPPHPTYHVPAKGFRGNVVRDTIEIHGSSWSAEYIRDLVKKCREFSWHWTKTSWIPRDIAVHRDTGKISFDVTLIENSKDFVLLKSGWKKDYCVICRWELFDSKDAADHSTGYTNGRDWLCTECFEKFIARSDYFSSNHPEMT
jgi:hypothetical protein